ncbi:DUF5819 family protein [Streptomyces sp. NBC_01013]|uniref:DUF5819 family protein n=1 Tax=Streptomyces sp. NBC_01013 TaxID=2903718 RepID=UPI003866E41B|nr:DUF5819 family protein [Streptomyces sp. NBC_01013]
MDSYDDKGVGGGVGESVSGGGGGTADVAARTVPEPRANPDTRADTGPDTDRGSRAEQDSGAEQGSRAEQDSGAEQGSRAERGSPVDSASHGLSGLGVDPGRTGHGPRVGMAGLSFPYQVVAAVALAVIGVIACVQLAMVFLHVAPSNTLTKQHGAAVDQWVYPEFEQNWKLFAPNPLQQNIAVHVRAEISGPAKRRTTPWMSLSGEDGKAIHGNLLPSHVQQNELRRGWDFYIGSHDSENRATGLRGRLSEQYIRRIVMLRLGEHDYGGDILRIQIRSEARSVAAPAWSGEKISTKPSYRVLPWWTVTAADLPKGSAASEEADQ